MSVRPSAEAWKFDRELAEICALPPGPEKERRRKDWARRLRETFDRRRPPVQAWQRVTHRDEP